MPFDTSLYLLEGVAVDIHFWKTMICSSCNENKPMPREYRTIKDEELLCVLRYRDIHLHDSCI